MKELIKITGINLPRQLFEEQNLAHEFRFDDSVGDIIESIYGIPKEDISPDDIERVNHVDSMERLAVVG